MTDTDTRSPAARLRALAASAISVRRLQQRAELAERESRDLLRLLRSVRRQNRRMRMRHADDRAARQALDAIRTRLGLASGESVTEAVDALREAREGDDQNGGER